MIKGIFISTNISGSKEIKLNLKMNFIFDYENNEFHSCLQFCFHFLSLKIKFYTIFFFLQKSKKKLKLEWNKSFDFTFICF